MAGETYTTKVPHVLSHSDNSLYSRYTYGDLRGWIKGAAHTFISRIVARVQYD